MLKVGAVPGMVPARVKRDNPMQRVQSLLRERFFTRFVLCVVRCAYFCFDSQFVAVCSFLMHIPRSVVEPTLCVPVIDCSIFQVPASQMHKCTG